MIELLNSIEQTTIDSFYQALTDALVDINGSNQFADDLTLFLLRQQPTSKKLLPRTADGARKLVMRWMKRKAPVATRRFRHFRKPLTCNWRV